MGDTRQMLVATTKALWVPSFAALAGKDVRGRTCRAIGQFIPQPEIRDIERQMLNTPLGVLGVAIDGLSTGAINAAWSGALGVGPGTEA